MAEPVISDDPYMTTEADAFISPYTPFLHHASVLEEDHPIQRWCEQRLIYYNPCTHSTEFRRCNNRDNPDREDNDCNDTCRLPAEYVVCASCLCPDCEPHGVPEPAVPYNEIERRCRAFKVRHRETYENFFQFTRDAEFDDANLVDEDIEDVLNDPRIVGEQILAELAAAVIEDAPDVMEEDGGYIDGESSESEDGSPFGGEPMEFEPGEPALDRSVGWLERLPRMHSTITREHWFRRLAWRIASAREMGNPPGPYYVPNNANDDSDLLACPEQPLTDGETCAICMMEFSAVEGQEDDVRRLPCTHMFHYECIHRWLYNANCPMCRHEYTLRRLPRFADEEGEEDSTDGSNPVSSSPVLPPAPPPSPEQRRNPQGGDP